jgi:hypothetical protein
MSVALGLYPAGHSGPIGIGAFGPVGPPPPLADPDADAPPLVLACASNEMVAPKPW